MKQYLIQKQWYRNITTKATFYKSNDKWHNLKQFKKGEKIEAIDGKWNTQVFCKCGNELVHSQSFIKERHVKESGEYVFDYKCSFCGVEQYFNPDIIPGLLQCDKNGISITTK